MPPVVPAADRDVLSTGARSFLADLARVHAPRLDELLRARRTRQAALDAGSTLGFRPESRAVRQAAWRVAAVGDHLSTRVVEVVVPVDRRSLIRGLNSGADSCIADFDDACAPTRRNMIDGHRNLTAAVAGTLAYEDVARGRRLRLGGDGATLHVRPRALHLVERTLTLAGRPVPAALADLGLHLFHNAHALAARGVGPCFVLSKVEGHLEARWWNSVLVHAQEALGLPLGTVETTVVIETLPAVFEMDEILYELRNHVAGLRLGRRNLVVSFVRTQRARRDALLPDRGEDPSAPPFVRAARRLLARTCRRRGAVALGGAAAVDVTEDVTEGDVGADAVAWAHVRVEADREARDGLDGTWVPDPALVPAAREAFHAVRAASEPENLLGDEVEVTAADLLAGPRGPRTDAGLRRDLREGVRALEGWLRGGGSAAPARGREDVATAELCRARVWQWLRHGATLADGRLVSPGLVRCLLDEEAAGLAGPRIDLARDVFARACLAERLDDPLTLEAYELLEPLPTGAMEISREAAR